MAGLGRALLVGGLLTSIAGAACAFSSRSVSRWLLSLGALCLVGSTTILSVAFIRGDYSLVYVADTSRRALSGPYRLSGLWGGMEGSLLMWTTMVAVVAAATATLLRSDDRRAVPTTYGVLGSLVAAFAAMSVFVANPFRTLAIPATDGGGLVPILEHPAMLYHPILLYLGLVTIAAPFSLTVGALRAGEVDETWFTTCRRWVYIPWILLTAGMLAGANWAYVEVGWGGYWAWDPVENGALLPWLALTAFMHCAHRGERRQLSSAALVLAAFVLACGGVLLTRSGAVTSVHSFAQSPTIGYALSLVVGGLIISCAILLIRARGDRDAARNSAPLVLRVQVGVAVAMIIVVLVGTLAPVVRSAAGGGQTLITGTYFATLATPLMWAALGALIIPMTRASPAYTAPILVGLSVTAVVAYFVATGAVTLVTAGLAAAAGTAVVRSASRARLAHLGFSVFLLGIAGSTATTTATGTLSPGESMSVGEVDIRNDSVGVDASTAEPRIVAHVTVTRGDALTTLEPMIVGYPTRGVRLAEPALWSTPAYDVQIALRNADDTGRGLFEVQVRPLAQVVWLGGLLMLAGGVVSLLGLGKSPWPERPGDEGAKSGKARTAALRDRFPIRVAS